MKNILITESTHGIGQETAKELAKKGHRIIIHGRSREKAIKVREELNSINSKLNHKAEESFRSCFQSETSAKIVE